ncbi:hypothetical protein O77CONTIG1_02335 [Leptolyngbya sp. O-77]|nr:hypothetical protein O77CONTIG1_02335 [Leptolyngbya sp. O-77]
MSGVNLPPKALFLSPDGKIYPDTLICSGMITAELNGKPCPYAQNGQLPDLVPLDENEPAYSPDKGKPGDLCPPCAKQQLANLGHWQGHGQQTFPEELLPLRLFKCRMWLWLVVPGLHDAEPTKLITDNSITQ